MKNSNENKPTATPLKKGFKIVFGAIPLLFLAPILMNIGYSPLKKAGNWILLSIASLIAVTAMFLLFWGIKTILDSFFQKK